MKKEKQAEALSTFLGTDTTIEGSINFKNTIRLDGKVKGTVQSNGGTLIVGEGAVIQADVNVGSAIIKGEINGSIMASKQIEVYPPAKIIGDIEAPVIAIESGVTFNGNCRMLQGDSAQEKGAKISPQTPPPQATE
jgi:cytoskeletal protein CcmA (bactofilin family)